MKLFSEKVSPTFTSSNLNILTVKEFVEVFFDVFEFEINGNKFIAEKISEYKGFPVVEVPLVFEGKKLTAPFVLQKGKQEILFNPDVSTIIGEAAEETPEPLIEYKESDDQIEELVLEKKETILKEIAQAKHSAAKYIERLKQQKLRETEEYLEEKQKIIETDLQESKKDLLEEFLVLVENVKSEFYSFNEDEKSKLEKFIESSIDRVSNELILSINHNRESAEEKFSIHIDELANKVLTGVLLKEINHNNDKSVEDINSRFGSISKSLEALFENNNKVIFDSVSNTLKDFNSTILTLEKANVEIADKLSKTNNKVLSRIGNVKNQLEESIAETTDNLINKIEATESKIIKYYNTNISLIENSVSGLVEENENYFINLINESKQSLLEQISNLKVDVPNIVIERSRGGRQEIDLKGIKSELEKNISTRFSNEIQYLKRLIEMSSGGGSVAVQFADGGTMNGSLSIKNNINVFGRILSGGVDLTDIFSTSNADLPFLPLSGGTISGSLSVSGPIDLNYNTSWYNVPFNYTYSNQTSISGTSQTSLSGTTLVLPISTLNSNVKESLDKVNVLYNPTTTYYRSSSYSISGTVGKLLVDNAFNTSVVQQALTALTDKVNSVYAYLIQNFDNNIVVTSSTINQFVATEWSSGLGLVPGSTITLSAANVVYILANGDGSGVNNYFEVNLKPNFLFYRANLANNSIIDAFPLSAMKSSKYIIQVEDKTTSDIFYTELNIVSNNSFAITSEYGTNYTTDTPFIEFGANIINQQVSLSATGINSFDMSNFIIKGNRTNVF